MKTPFQNETARRLQEEQAEATRVFARLTGQRYRLFVLAPSRNQFEKWCDENIYRIGSTVPVYPPMWVTEARHLFGVRLSPGIELIEVDGWEAQASAELLWAVRRLKQFPAASAGVPKQTKQTNQ